MSRLRTGLISLGLLLLALAPALGLRAQQDDSAPPIALTYQWERQYYGRINGVEALLYHRSFSRAKLSFADIDGDGNLLNYRATNILKPTLLTSNTIY